jgi:ribosomal protein S8
MKFLFFLLNKIQQGIEQKKTYIQLKKKRSYFLFLAFLIKENFILSYCVVDGMLIIYLVYNKQGKSAVQYIKLNSYIHKIIDYKSFLFSKKLGLTLIFLTKSGYCTQTQMVNRRENGTLICAIG